MNDKLILLEDVIWTENSQYFFYTTQLSLEINIQAISEFFTDFSLNIKNSNYILMIEVILNKEEGKSEQILVKNYINMVGSQPSIEKGYEKSEDYIYKNYTKIVQICSYIEAESLNIKYIFTPYNILWKIYKKKFYKFEIFSLNSKLEVLEISQYAYKYYIILKDRVKIRYPNDYLSQYSYIINYKYEMTDKEIAIFNEDTRKINASQSKFQSKISREILHKPPAIVYNNILSWLHTNYPLCTANEDAFLKKAFFGGRRELISNYPYKEKEKYIISCDMPGAYFKSLDGIFPEGCHTLEKHTNIEEGILDNAFYTCTVKIPTTVNIAPLPHVYGNVIFPTGEFTGTWFGSELNLIKIVGGEITRMYYRYTWENWSYKFKDFAEYVNNSKNSLDWIQKKLKITFFGSMAKRPTEVTKLIYKQDNVSSITKIRAEDTENLTNYYITSIITSRCRVEIYKICQILIDNNLPILFINVDSIEFLATFNELGYLVETYPQYKDFWKKKKIYEESLYLNTSTIIRRGVDSGVYIDQLSKLTFTEEEFRLIKKEFSNTHNNFTKIKGKTITFNSYKGRVWDFYRQKSNPHIRSDN